MDGLTIRPEELRTSASNMKSKVAAMRENLEKASSVMNQTSEYFEASSADALRERYNQLKTKFDSFYTRMGAYAEFLEKTAAKYDQTNEAIQKAANDVLES